MPTQGMLTAMVTFQHGNRVREVTFLTWKGKRDTLKRVRHAQPS